METPRARIGTKRMVELRKPTKGEEKEN